MGVVSSRWVWVESMGVASRCGCKEVYRYIYCYNIYISYYLSLLHSFLAAASLLFVHSFKCFLFLFLYFFVIYLIFFSRSANTHTGNYGRPTEAI